MLRKLSKQIRVGVRKDLSIQTLPYTVSLKGFSLICVQLTTLKSVAFQVGLVNACCLVGTRAVGRTAGRPHRERIPRTFKALLRKKTVVHAQERRRTRAV